MTTHSDAVARLTAAGLNDETATKIADELLGAPGAEVDPLREFVGSLFGGDEPTTPPEPAKKPSGHVAAEGNNPPAHNTADAELREYARDLFGRGD